MAADDGEMRRGEVPGIRKEEWRKGVYNQRNGEGGRRKEAIKGGWMG